MAEDLVPSILLANSEFRKDAKSVLSLTDDHLNKIAEALSKVPLFDLPIDSLAELAKETDSLRSATIRLDPFGSTPVPGVAAFTHVSRRRLAGGRKWVEVPSFGG